MNLNNANIILLSDAIYDKLEEGVLTKDNAYEVDLVLLALENTIDSIIETVREAIDVNYR